MTTLRWPAVSQIVIESELSQVAYHSVTSGLSTLHCIAQIPSASRSPASWFVIIDLSNWPIFYRSFSVEASSRLHPSWPGKQRIEIEGNDCHFEGRRKTKKRAMETDLGTLARVSKHIYCSARQLLPPGTLLLELSLSTDLSMQPIY